ncbi:uncharacterized protein [Takifugu rubripes]|uniref:uncharacterized protein n=1 Tax=Takifugu rubripes TaxID=31033 RepID=UPI0011458841|nr:uncharacterized protein LOC115248737 [Takifugu rubripes]
MGHSRSSEAFSQILSLRQGPSSVADYSIRFCILAARSGWNDAALQGVFTQGLSDDLKDELAAREQPETLEALIGLATRLDNRLRERRRQRMSERTPSPARSFGGRSWCQLPSWWIRVQTATSLARTWPGRFAFPSRRCPNRRPFWVSTEKSWLGLPTGPRQSPSSSQEIIGNGSTSSSSSPGVLGSPWLALHNPQFDWPTGRLVSWSVNCHTNCLRSAVTSSSGTSAPAQEIPDLSQVPREYHDLGKVFCKQRALSLPPHRPYDCAIGLLPGATLPSSRLYNLSMAEREAMENYIGESLASGLIRPSSSPVGAGFFFVQKKD